MKDDEGLGKKMMADDDRYASLNSNDTRRPID